MPINVTHVEPTIYRAEWQGVVTIEEVIIKMKDLTLMADQNSDRQYVLIVDLSTVARIPFDIHNLRKTADSDARVACYIIVQAPPVGKMLGRMLDKVSQQNFAFADTLEDGIEQARLFLAQNNIPIH